MYLCFGSDFKESASVLKYLLFGVLFLSGFKLLNQDLAGKGKPWVSMKAMLPGLLINIALNVYLIPKYGAIGAAFASSVSYGVAILLFLHFYSLTAGIKIKDMFNYKKSDFKPIVVFLNKIMP